MSSLDSHEDHHDDQVHTHSDQRDHSAQDHDHKHGIGILDALRDAIPFLHGHTHGEVSLDSALESNERGLSALKLSLAILAVTAVFQLLIALASGSVGLLADTIHNFSDALTAIPLGIAFILGRRLATRRYTYGYGRAEDIAGTVIILMIFASALLAAYESYQKIVAPRPIENAGWVMVAAVVGFLGNEVVALIRIRTGKAISSTALIADAQHAQVDGFTSLAVFFGALGSLLGFPIVDPIIGLLITVVILFVVRDTVVAMLHRMMDAIDPSIVNSIEHAAEHVQGVQRVSEVRGRWVGHSLMAELNVAVDEDLSTRDSHQIAEEVRHALFHEQPKLASVTVHVEPFGHGEQDAHDTTAHHVKKP
ncbi:MAG TPA: cation diffusion facilitator family transporter [Aggregatilineales bacterium]|nr:cation diffusion facilitator family transporter [Aggregatilineales bacterium]